MGDETVDTKIRNPEGDKVNVSGTVPLIGNERFVKLDVLFSSITLINKVPIVVDKKGDQLKVQLDSIEYQFTTSTYI